MDISKTRNPDLERLIEGVCVFRQLKQRGPSDDDSSDQATDEAQDRQALHLLRGQGRVGKQGQVRHVRHRRRFVCASFIGETRGQSLGGATPLCGIRTMGCAEAKREKIWSPPSGLAEWEAAKLYSGVVAPLLKDGGGLQAKIFSYSGL